MNLENDTTEKRLNIWTYWESVDSKPMPAYLQLCLNSIKKTNPTANIHLVTPININQYIPQIDVPLDDIKLKDSTKNPISLKTDYIRVRLLHDYGGLWLDIDCILLQKIEGMINQYLKSYSFVGMRKISKSKPYFTNNFMASRARGNIVTEYLREMTRHIEKKVKKEEPFEWSEIGSAMLTSIIKENNQENSFTLEESLIHPFDFTEHLLLEKPLEDIKIYSIISEKITKNTYCLMLYNALISEEFKCLSHEEILLSNTVIGHVLKNVLGPDNQSNL
ncbi:MAG: capsular polysaccharide synthesis protein [Pseudomonadales bacterium]|nr:capsular polysaccharide synthesis protein [Pseudomonadales bacterium]